MSVLVSIAVVSYNTRELTLRCLKAAEEAAGANGTVLTVVDNGSSDGTVEAVRRERPAWRVMVAPENPGYGSALNRAFREAPGWSYLTLNSDILLGPDALRILMDFLQRHPECGLVGPALTYPDGRTQPSAKRFPSSPFALAEVCWLNALFPRNRLVRRFYYADQDLANHPWVDTVSGAAMLIRGEAFRRVGGFDEGFRMYFEETDLCRRLHDAGYRVALCTQATAVHWHGASTIQTSVRQVEYYLSYVRYFWKHHGSVTARMLAAAVAVSTVLRMLALLLKYPPLSRRRLDVLRAKLAACRRLLRDLWRPATTQATKEGLS
jgi:GT2 family glycosyltransferase